MDDHTAYENFDPNFCGLATKMAAGFCLLLLLATLALLSISDSSIISSVVRSFFAVDHDTVLPLTVYILIQAATACWLSWTAANWTTYAQHIEDRLREIQQDASLLLFLDLNKLFVVVLIGFVVFSSIPLAALLVARFLL